MKPRALTILLLCLLTSSFMPRVAGADDWDDCTYTANMKPWISACSRVMERVGISDERRAFAESQLSLAWIEHSSVQCSPRQDRLRELAEKYPKPEFQFNYARSYMTCIDYKKAAQLFDQVLFENENYPGAHFWKAKALRLAGVFQESADEYLAAIRQTPRHIATYEELAKDYEELRQFDKAVWAYNFAIKYSEKIDVLGTGIYLTRRAHAFLALGNKKAAVADYKRAKKIDPTLEPISIAPGFEDVLKGK